MRLELGALVAAFALEQLVRGTVTLQPLIFCGITSAIASLGESSSSSSFRFADSDSTLYALPACTIAVDSYFWQKPIDSLFWPEGSSFFFNVVQGKASDWGVSNPNI